MTQPPRRPENLALSSNLLYGLISVRGVRIPPLRHVPEVLELASRTTPRRESPGAPFCYHFASGGRIGLSPSTTSTLIHRPERAIVSLSDVWIGMSSAARCLRADPDVISSNTLG